MMQGKNERRLKQRNGSLYRSTSPLFVALELFIIGFAEKPFYVTNSLAAFFVNCAKIDELQ